MLDKPDASSDPFIFYLLSPRLHAGGHARQRGQGPDTKRRGHGDRGRLMAYYHMRPLPGAHVSMVP